MTLKTTEQVKEELIEALEAKNNYQQEIVVNEGCDFYIQAAIGINIEKLNGEISFITYNGIKQYIQNGFYGLRQLAYVIQNHLQNNIGYDISKVTIHLFKYDKFQGINQLIPTFNRNSIDYYFGTRRKLVDPRTLKINYEEMTLYFVDSLFDRYKDNFSEEFLEKYENDFEGFAYRGSENAAYYYNKFSNEEREFMQMCSDYAKFTFVDTFVYGDKYLGFLELHRTGKEVDILFDHEKYTTVKALKIPFEVFGIEVHKYASLKVID